MPGSNEGVQAKGRCSACTQSALNNVSQPLQPGSGKAPVCPPVPLAPADPTAALTSRSAGPTPCITVLSGTGLFLIFLLQAGGVQVPARGPAPLRPRKHSPKYSVLSPQQRAAWLHPLTLVPFGLQWPAVTRPSHCRPEFPRQSGIQKVPEAGKPSPAPGRLWDLTPSLTGSALLSSA